MILVVCYFFVAPFFAHAKLCLSGTSLLHRWCDSIQQRVTTRTHDFFILVCLLQKGPAVVSLKPEIPIDDLFRIIAPVVVSALLPVMLRIQNRILPPAAAAVVLPVHGIIRVVGDLVRARMGGCELCCCFETRVVWISRFFDFCCFQIRIAMIALVVATASALRLAMFWIENAEAFAGFDSFPQSLLQIGVTPEIETVMIPWNIYVYCVVVRSGTLATHPVDLMLFYINIFLLALE